jgi:hypothetical protein
MLQIGRFWPEAVFRRSCGRRPLSEDVEGLASEYAAALGRPVLYATVPLDEWRGEDATQHRHDNIRQEDDSNKRRLLDSNGARGEEHDASDQD